MINAYFNGEFCSADKIRIPLGDRALWFGDGVYDAAIGRNGKIYMPSEHIDRFFSNAERLSISLPVCKEELRIILYTLAEKADKCGFFIYFQATRTSACRSHAYPDDASSNLLVTVREHIPPKPDTALKLITLPDNRYKLCHIKTLNLLPAVLASRKATECSADEAVFVRDGFVTECAHSNIHAIINGALVTHPTNEYILPGTARAALIELAKEKRVPVVERPFTLSELYSADEVLVTSSSKLCLCAAEIDGISYLNGKGALEEESRKAYSDRIGRFGGREKHRDSSDLGERLCRLMYERFLENTR